MTPVIDLPRAAALAAGLKSALMSAADAEGLRTALLALLGQACALANGQPGALRLVPRAAALTAPLSVRDAVTLDIDLQVTFTSKVGGPRIVAQSAYSGLSVLAQALEQLGGSLEQPQVHERHVMMLVRVPLKRAPRIARLFARREKLRLSQLRHRSRRREKVEAMWSQDPELRAMKERIVELDAQLARVQAERAQLHQQVAHRNTVLFEQVQTAPERKLQVELDELMQSLGGPLQPFPGQ